MSWKRKKNTWWRSEHTSESHMLPQSVSNFALVQCFFFSRCSWHVLFVIGRNSTAFWLHQWQNMRFAHLISFSHTVDSRPKLECKFSLSSSFTLTNMTYRRYHTFAQPKCAELRWLRTHCETAFTDKPKRNKKKTKIPTITTNTKEQKKLSVVFMASVATAEPHIYYITLLYV